jgi:hypothetical protein
MTEEKSLDVQISEVNAALKDATSLPQYERQRLLEKAIHLSNKKMMERV